MSQTAIDEQTIIRLSCELHTCQKERDALKVALRDAVDDVNAYRREMRAESDETIDSYYRAPQAEPEAKA